MQGVLAGLGIGREDVLAHGAGEEERLLQHQADAAAQVVAADVAHVHAADGDCAPPPSGRS